MTSGHTSWGFNQPTSKGEPALRIDGQGLTCDTKQGMIDQNQSLTHGGEEEKEEEEEEEVHAQYKYMSI